MAHSSDQRTLLDTLAAAFGEEAGATRYRLAQSQARSGRANIADRAHPLEFDESGFPIPQRPPNFAARVARLLTPS